MSHTVIGVFDNQSAAQTAISELASTGFTRDYIDVAGQGIASATSSYGGSTANPNQDTGSVGDNVGNFFGSLFNSDQAHSYSQVARQGITITIHARSAEEATRAAEILDRNGAVDLDERSSQYGTGTTATSSTTDATSGTLPVIQEELQVGKRVVETGGVRLRSRVLERPVEEHLRLREEHVHLERNPVNRNATEADFAAFKEGTIEITEHAEVPVVAKEARVVEEVRLEKEVEERQETVRDTVRGTEVEVENLGTTSTTGITDATGMTGTADTTGLAGATGMAAAGAGLTGVGHGASDNQNELATGGTLRRMREIEKDYEVRDDNEDVRGWDVMGQDGQKIGEVDDMIVDMDAMKVRYLEVELDGSLPGVTGDHRVLVPVGTADLDQSSNIVLVPNLDSSMISSYPAYRGEPITRDYEHSLMSAFSPGYQASSGQNSSFYDHEYFSNRRSVNRGSGGGSIL